MSDNGVCCEYLELIIKNNFVSNNHIVAKTFFGVSYWVCYRLLYIKDII